MRQVELEVPRFGEFARQYAWVSSADISRTLQLQQRSGGRLGTLMLRSGLIDEEQLVDLVRRQARWVAKSRAADLVDDAFPMSMPVSICMPCFNEARVIDEVLTGALTVLPEFLDEFEIIIVDDGSQDQTAAIVEQYAAKDSRVRLIRHEKNRGYGASVATGLRAASGEMVFFTDGDGQFNLLDLPQLLVEAQRSDVVVGYRYNRADHAMRKFNALGWKMIIRGLMGLRIRDLDCAFKLFPRRVIDRLQLDAEGACISAEIMVQCMRGGVSICEVPVNHYPRAEGKATGANLKVIAKAFRELPVVWKYRKLQPWTWDSAAESSQPPAGSAVVDAVGEPSRDVLPAPVTAPSLNGSS